MTVGHRLTSRILLFDEGGNILLFLTTAPDTSGFARWVTPGGGVDEGESHEDAAIRELREETGLAIDHPGESVWAYDFDVEWDNADHDTGHAEYYVVRTRRFEPSSEGWTDDERIDTLQSRWWSLDELRGTDEPFEPAHLLELVEQYRFEGESQAMPHAVPEYTLEDLEAAGRIELDHFTNDDAFDLGTLAAEVTRAWGLNLAVDIVIGDYLVYRARLGTTGPANDEWLRGKAAVARHFGDSSLLVRRRQEATGVPFTDLPLDHEVMRAHGGSIPLYVGGAVVATITMSGEPDVVDHEAATEALRRYRGSLS